MSENNLPNEGMENEETNAAENIEEVIENAADSVEETFEDIADGAEEVIENAAEGVEEVIDNAGDFIKDNSAEMLKKAKSAVSKFKTCAIIAWILVVLLLAVDVYYYMTNIYNKYNHMGYLNTNGYTIGEVVAGMGMEFEEFKEMYGLPDDMRKDTYMNAAQSLISVSKMAELNGTDLAGLKERYKFGDEITEASTWGEAIDSMALRDYVGEDQFDSFKEQYALGDEVTLDTKWGEIRKTVEKKQVEERLAEENAKNEEESEPESTEDTADTEDGAAEEETNADAVEETENAEAEETEAAE